MSRDNGFPRLVPNDSSTSMQDQMAMPELNRVAFQCSTKLPIESRKLFKHGNITLMHINARSLHQSYDEIVSLVTVGEHKTDFLLISESWLDPDLAELYQIPGYDMHHSIPHDSFAGKGSAIYVRRNFSPYCERIDSLCVKQTEFQSVFVQVKCPNNPVFIVGTVYRSPSYPLSVFMMYLEQTLSYASNFNKVCFIGGDWNIDLFHYNEKSEVKFFLDCLNSYGFFPTITVTSRTSNCPPYTQTLIDNIFCNALETVKESCASDVGIADHQAVICASDLLKSPQRKPPVLKPKFNFDRADELKANITQRLVNFQMTDDVEYSASNFSKTIMEEISKLSTTRTSRHCMPIQPWVTPGLLRSINKKNSLLKNFHKNRTSENEKKY